MCAVSNETDLFFGTINNRKSGNYLSSSEMSSVLSKNKKKE
jgi:hypothetical protein